MQRNPNPDEPMLLRQVEDPNISWRILHQLMERLNVCSPSRTSAACLQPLNCSSEFEIHRMQFSEPDVSITQEC